MRLSILICSLVDRAEKLRILLENLSQQTDKIENGLVEILIEIDNKEISTGAKRNKLLNRAKGDYICFIDDDDSVMPCYIELILRAIETNPDCVATTGFYSINGGHKQTWKLSKNYTDHDADGILYRRTNHLSPVKRELALLAMFPNISNAEDKAYSEALNKHLNTETIIDVPIYHYDYSTFNKSYA